MVELEDSVLIRVAPERVWAWLVDLPRHYRDWHPDHVSCHYEHGEDMQVGSVLVFEEYLHGRLHRLRLRATEVTPSRAIRYRGQGMEGAFLISPEDTGSRFTATISFGTRVPIIGIVSDALLRLIMADRLAILREHMREEGRDLKLILERQSDSHEAPQGTQGAG